MNFRTFLTEFFHGLRKINRNFEKWFIMINRNKMSAVFNRLYVVELAITGHS